MQGKSFPRDFRVRQKIERSGSSSLQNGQDEMTLPIEVSCFFPILISCVLCVSWLEILFYHSITYIHVSCIEAPPVLRSAAFVLNVDISFLTPLDFQLGERS